MNGSGKLQFIKMTSTELEIFHIAEKHLSDLTILVKNGIFELKNGKIIIHKDNDGKIRKIEVERITFKT